MSDRTLIVEAEFTLLGKKNQKGFRASRRYHCNLATLCRWTDAEGKEEIGWVHDLSKVGIGLSLGRPLEIGTPLVIQLKGNYPPRRVLNIDARVVHSTAEIHGQWRVGCTFSRHLSEEELDPFLD